MHGRDAPELALRAVVHREAAGKEILRGHGVLVPSGARVFGNLYMLDIWEVDTLCGVH